MIRHEIITVGMVVLLLSGVSLALAAPTDIDTFEDGDMIEWSDGSITTSPVYEGSFAGDFTGADGFRDVPEEAYQNITYRINFTKSQDPGDGLIIQWQDFDAANTVVAYTAIRPGPQFQFENGSNFVTEDIGLKNNSWYSVRLEKIDWGAKTYNIVVYNETMVLKNYTNVQMPGGDDANIDRINVRGDSPNTVYIDSIRSGEGAPEFGGPGPTQKLEIDIRSWMPRDSTQPYKVYLNETNTTTGESNITEVTADANVTIYNVTNTTGFSEPIATVNNTTDTIVSYNQTGVVAVNATYQGNTAGNGTNLTVGPRNLTNIGIMPPEQWPCSFLGCDSAPGGGDNPHNIGSSMQMLWLIIFIMVAGTQMIENPWAGVGSGIVSGILFWVMEFIDLGTMLTIVFAGILVGLLMARTSMGRGVTRDNEYSGAAVKSQDRK